MPNAGYQGCRLRHRLFPEVTTNRITNRGTQRFEFRVHPSVLKRQFRWQPSLPIAWHNSSSKMALYRGNWDYPARPDQTSRYPQTDSSNSVQNAIASSFPVPPGLGWLKSRARVVETYF